MFDAKDFISYFTEIQMIEKNMRDIYEEAAKDIKDQEDLKIFEELSKAEERHEKLVDGLRRLAIEKSMDDEK